MVCDEYHKKRVAGYGWFTRLLSKTVWPVKFYVSDRIEELKYKLYCRLYMWFDCLPPDERDLKDRANG